MDNIFECFERIGIFLSEEEKTYDLILSDYIEDSLQFINFIVTIESVFDIEWPDEAIAQSDSETLSDIMEIIHRCTIKS